MSGIKVVKLSRTPEYGPDGPTPATTDWLPFWENGCRNPGFGCQPDNLATARGKQGNQRCRRLRAEKLVLRRCRGGPANVLNLCSPLLAELESQPLRSM